jgi:hypothetical protein
MTNEMNAWVNQAHARARALAELRDAKFTTTSPTHIGGAYVIDIDGRHAIAQFVAWSGGASEATILDIGTEQRVYFRESPASTENLDQLYGEFLVALRRAECAVP